jgi:eukaryotic-like serine/threonine-protein kinase
MSNNDTILKNRYRLIAQQASGGMAVVYKAIDLELSRTVAVKVLRPSLISDPSFLTRFRNEARSVANLTHPNIVTVHDVGNDGQAYFIVMEFVEGQDLKKIIKTEGILSVERVLKLSIQICAGIGFAHRAGLVHADVKPQNILVKKGDLVKVTDFGIAQAFSDSQPSEKQAIVWGSPHYFSPEQAQGERPTPASDVYSIGIVMFEMLTGRLPYVGVDQQQLAMAHIRERVPMATEVNASIPETLSQIVYKVMSKEPSARFRTADQLGHVLESYRDRGKEQTFSSAPAVHPPPPPPAEVPPRAPFSQAQPPQPQPLPFSQPAQPAQPPLPFSQSQPAVNQPPNHASQTERYSAAPNAPQAQPHNRPGVQSPFEHPAAPPQPGQPYQQSGSQPLQPWTGGTSQPLYPRRQEEDIPSALDVVTIALAVLAFFAVLCLIPLWIQVYLVRFAGG